MSCARQGTTRLRSQPLRTSWIALAFPSPPRPPATRSRRRSSPSRTTGSLKSSERLPWKSRRKLHRSLRSWNNCWQIPARSKGGSNFKDRGADLGFHQESGPRCLVFLFRGKILLFPAAGRKFLARPETSRRALHRQLRSAEIVLQERLRVGTGSRICKTHRGSPGRLHRDTQGSD